VEGFAMRAIFGIIVLLAVMVAGAWALGLIDIQQTRDGKMPVIKAEAGELPGFDVKTSKIEMGSTNTMVDVPTVGTRKERVETPTIDVKKPE